MGQDAGPQGPVGPQGREAKLGPEACYREEFETAAAAGLINHSEPLSTSEVVLNFWPRRGKRRPLVLVGGTNRD